jgi:hypothetical protein
MGATVIIRRWRSAYSITRDIGDEGDKSRAKMAKIRCFVSLIVVGPSSQMWFMMSSLV